MKKKKQNRWNLVMVSIFILLVQCCFWLTDLSWRDQRIIELSLTLMFGVFYVWHKYYSAKFKNVMLGWVVITIFDMVFSAGQFFSFKKGYLFLLSENEINLLKFLEYMLYLLIFGGMAVSLAYISMWLCEKATRGNR